MLKFPEKFYWGASTSSYQVEGGIKNDWSESGEKYDAGICCDHYNRFEEDFDLAKSMNHNAHRFSIEWARIEPEEGKFDQKEIEHYRKVILALKERGMEPFVTLYHWTLPIWFVKKGGWLNKDAPEYFGKFVEKIVLEYKDLVKFWITLNEPNVYTFHSYFLGDWPSFKRSLSKTKLALRQLSEAHKKAYILIHRISPNTKVGIAYQKGESKISSHEWIYNFFKSIKDYQDFIGLNYYFSGVINFALNRILLKKSIITDVGWEINPKGIYGALKKLKQYNKPIYITENGLADAKDRKREDFIINHLKWIYQAIEEGIDVRGYLHWSLIDNFEWAKGFKPRFGLIEIDYENNLKRIPRPSSKVYAEICKNNAL